jgi:hypothetical protein
MPESLSAQLYRLRLLARVHLEGLVPGAELALLLLLGAALLVACPVGWNGEHLSVWGVDLPDFAPGLDRNGAVVAFVTEMLSWGWVVVLLGYVLPRVLLPLAASFAPNQVLWQRLSCCTARDVSYARGLRVLVVAALVGGLTVVLALVAAWRFEIPVVPLLDAPAGLAGQIVLAGGLIVFLCPLSRTQSGRLLVAVAAGLVPVLSLLPYLSLRQHLVPFLALWWPFAVPFTAPLGPQVCHNLACLFLGFVCLAVATLAQPGRPRSFDSLSRKDFTP